MFKGPLTSSLMESGDGSIMEPNLSRKGPGLRPISTYVVGLTGLVAGIYPRYGSLSRSRVHSANVLAGSVRDEVR